MKAQIKCFGCKEKREIELTKESVSQTKNNRYVANINCDKCGRKMTSLVSRAAFDGLHTDNSKPEEKVSQ